MYNSVGECVCKRGDEQDRQCKCIAIMSGVGAIYNTKWLKPKSSLSDYYKQHSSETHFYYMLQVV